MSEKEMTKIEWCNYTFNPWWGCTKVSAGCKNCYAETLDARFKGQHWGKDSPRKFFGESHWKGPAKWNRRAEREGVRYRVFCASMADVFERHESGEINSELDAARARLWTIIEETPHLDWLLLTKRPENIDMVPNSWWDGDGDEPGNVWLGVTAENQKQADARIPLLLTAEWAAHRFVSYEPAIESVGLDPRWLDPLNGGIDWVIAGAESGLGARPMNEDWVRAVRDQCADARVPFFYKQRLEDGRKISLPELDGVVHAEFPDLI